MITGQTGLIYKGKDGTGRIIKPDEYQPKGSYAAANHNHSGVYQPVGSYAAANHSHNGTNLSYNNTLSINDAINNNYSMIVAANNEISSLKSSVSNGKSLIAAAVTDKGVPTAASDSFTTMSNNIRNIETDPNNHLKNDTLPSGYTKRSYIEISGGCVINTQYTLPKMYYERDYTVTSCPKYEWGYIISINSKSGKTSSDRQGLIGVMYGSGGQSQLDNLFYYHDMSSGQAISQKYIGDGWTDVGPYILGTILNYKFVLNQYTNGGFYSSFIKCVNNIRYEYSGNCSFNMSSGDYLTFGYWGGSEYYSPTYKARIHGFYCKLENTNTYYANMVPCINSSGTPGLYDTIRNIFVTGTSQGSITAG